MGRDSDARVRSPSSAGSGSVNSLTRRSAQRHGRPCSWKTARGSPIPLPTMLRPARYALIARRTCAAAAPQPAPNTGSPGQRVVGGGHAEAVAAGGDQDLAPCRSQADLACTKRHSIASATWHRNADQAKAAPIAPDQSSASMRGGVRVRPTGDAGGRGQRHGARQEQRQRAVPAPGHYGTRVSWESARNGSA